MSSQQRTVNYIVEQVAAAGIVTSKKMFGEYGIYCDDKMVALVCDDRLFVKPTAAGRAHLGTVREGAPYKGAKLCFVIPGEMWEDADWLTKLFRVSADELPKPVRKRKKPVR